MESREKLQRKRRGPPRTSKEPRRNSIDEKSDTESDNTVPSTDRITRSAFRNSQSSTRSPSSSANIQTPDVIVFLYELWGSITTFFWSTTSAIMIPFQRSLHPQVKCIIVGVAVASAASLSAISMAPAVDSPPASFNTSATDGPYSTPSSFPSPVPSSPPFTDIPMSTQVSGQETFRKFENATRNWVIILSDRAQLTALAELLQPRTTDIVPLHTSHEKTSGQNTSNARRLRFDLKMFDHWCRLKLEFLLYSLEAYESRLKMIRDPTGSRLWKFIVGTHAGLSNIMIESLLLLFKKAEEALEAPLGQATDILDQLKHIRGMLDQWGEMYEARSLVIERENRKWKFFWKEKEDNPYGEVLKDIARNKLLTDETAGAIAKIVQSFQEAIAEIENLERQLSMLDAQSEGTDLDWGFLVQHRHNLRMIVSALRAGGAWERTQIRMYGGRVK